MSRAPETRRRALAAQLFVAAISLLHGACTSAPRSPFPSAAALAQLAAQPISSTTAPEPIADVDEWKLTGPLPDAVELQLRSPVTAWDRLLADAAAVHAGQVLVTESAQCAAREIGLFRAAHPTAGIAAGVAAGAPSDGLLRFIAARCGLAAPILQAACRANPSSPALSDDQLFAADSPPVRAEIAEALDRHGAAPLLAGLWVGRSESNQALICWAVASHLIHARRIPMSPDASGRIVIEGELVGSASRFDTLVTVGRLGVRACATRWDVAVPRVAAACLIDPGDTAAWIEITAYQPGQINGRQVLSLLAWRDGAPGDTYRRAGAGANQAAAPVACAPAAATADALGACINQMRSEAGLSPLSISGQESQTAARLAPHLFASLAGLEPPSTAEQVTLGLRAGWDVGSPLMFGQLAQAAHVGAPDAGQVVTTMLEHPGGRSVLLDPASSTMAVAVSPAGDSPGGGVVATYRPAVPGVFDQWPQITRIVGRLNRMRAARGLGPVTDFSPGVGTTREEARFLTEGHRTPRLAISNAAEDSARNMRVAHVHGWIAEADSPDSVLIPRPLIELPTVELAVGVAHHRRRGEPWTEFVVLFVMPHLAEGRLDSESDVVFAPLRTNLSRVP